MNNYYTYAYLREDGTPYYVGKGKDKRINDAQHNINLPPKERRLFLKKNLTEQKAFEHEKYMIAILGRKDLGTGILYNRTSGGEGGSGVVMNDETRRKISEKLKGKEVSNKTRKKLSESLKGNKNGKGNCGIKHSLEFKEKLHQKKTKPDNEVTTHALYMREYREKKLKYSSEERKEISRQERIERQSKKYQITFDDGRTIIVNGLIKFAKDNGYSSGIFNVMNGTYKRHKDIVAVERLDPFY